MNLDKNPPARSKKALLSPLPACPHSTRNQQPIRVDSTNFDDATAQAFSNYVLAGDHPCVMARSMVNRKQVFLSTYAELGNVVNCASVCHDLYEVLKVSKSEGSLNSFAAVFPAKIFNTELAFEQALWAQLAGMHEVDKKLFSWDASVSNDIGSPEFSFSLGGVAWYVVGLHPRSSRKSRQFLTPTLMFNRHAQFEVLRHEGKYDNLRDRIRDRDRELQGSTNPMLEDHGHSSEASQYSGREVDSTWRCPFAREH